MENQFDHAVEVLCVDIGGEFFSNEFDRYLKDLVSQCHFNTTDTPSKSKLAKLKSQFFVEIGLLRCYGSGACECT